MPLSIKLYTIVLKEKYYTEADIKTFVEYFAVSKGKTVAHLKCLCLEIMRS